MKPSKVWLYLWPEDKKIKDAQVLFKRISIHTQKNLQLKEYVGIIHFTNK